MQRKHKSFLSGLCPSYISPIYIYIYMSVCVWCVKFKLPSIDNQKTDHRQDITCGADTTENTFGLNGSFGQHSRYSSQSNRISVLQKLLASLCKKTTAKELLAARHSVLCVWVCFGVFSDNFDNKLSDSDAKNKHYLLIQTNVIRRETHQNHPLPPQPNANQRHKPPVWWVQVHSFCDYNQIKSHSAITTKHNNEADVWSETLENSKTPIDHPTTARWAEGIELIQWDGWWTSSSELFPNRLVKKTSKTKFFVVDLVLIKLILSVLLVSNILLRICACMTSNFELQVLHIMHIFESEKANSNGLIAQITTERVILHSLSHTYELTYENHRKHV